MDVAPRKHLQTGMLLGWALFISIVIMVAAGLSRALVAELSADEINTDASSNTLNFTDAWIRATPPGATTAAAYVDIAYPFVPGNTEILTLVFEKAGAREVSFTIIDPRSMQE
jgi:copper(I)-binding protein